MSAARTFNRNRNGIILWEGPSPIDGAPLVCIATGIRVKSGNGKTGALVQTWILRADVTPLYALGSGQDVSTCGNCPHRPFLGGKCYVNVGKYVRGIWACYERGGYMRRGDPGWAEAHARLLGAQGLPLRAGSYGDPALVPLDVWSRLNVVTGYTHQWRRPFAAGHRALFMASVDGPGDYSDAKAAGWRCFQVAPRDTVAAPEGSIMCPSSRGVECADCRLCGGLQRAGARDIMIPAHGFRVGNGGLEHGLERQGPTYSQMLRVLQ